MIIRSMAKHLHFCLFLIFFVLDLIFGFQVNAVPYDYSFTQECLVTPLKPQYNGGIIKNPELNEGLKGWTTFGDANIEHRQSDDGNKYIVALNRKQSFHSFSQEFNMEKDKLYTFSAWLQVSHGNADIKAVFKTKTNEQIAGWVKGRKGCWSMLKGGVVVDVSGPAQLYFESNNTEVDILADSISLQPFTHQEWKSHQDQSIEKFRKTRVKFQAMDQHGQPIANATVSIKQRRSNFPIGCAINKNFLGNTAYQNWLASKFKYTVFTNELKWYSTERSPGVEDYSVSDAMVKIAKSRGIAVRGHNIFWDNPAVQPSWVRALSPTDLSKAANRRINSVVGRYKGQLFHWDVMNENIHFNFFESKLGANASTVYYQTTNKLDSSTIPFLNEYNTIEYSGEVTASPSNYLNKIKQIRQQGYNGPLGIGVEGHFSLAPNMPYIRSTIDQLASSKLPIWATELDVTPPGPNQATYLDKIMRELISHAGMQGIMVWAPLVPSGCTAMCLTDANFKNLPTGDVVDKIMNELSHANDAPGITDSNGFFETSLFHGEYEAKISHPKGDEFLNYSKKINVVPNKEGEERKVHRFRINV